MKLLKKITALLAAAVMCTACTFTVYAENSDKVVDNADLLSDSEETELEAYILEIIEKYDHAYDIAIVTTDSTDGKSAEAYADDYYDYNGYGYGGENSGVILLLDMGDRAWHISTCGKGITVFTDYGIETAGERIVPYLSDGDYYGGFNEFASCADYIIGTYETGGKPYDNYTDGDSSGGYSSDRSPGRMFLISLVAGLIAALIVCLIMKAQLKTAVKQFGAGNYIRRGSLNVNYSRDIFLYKTVSRHKIETNSGGHGGGGSSTHIGSSGSSHGGGGGHF